MKITGQCACGAVSYVIDEGTELDIANCHCRECRRSSGGTYVTWATVKREHLNWTGSPPAQRNSSEHTVRFFCPTCGSQLALLTNRTPDTIDVTVATFDKPDAHAPTRDIWLKRKLPWVPLDPALPGEDEETL